ncbi:uncharacterized protein B0I36DRAFT_369429 [Microdochium trichocladiopsis]|uniref:Uncharacterized protein n=1 Tax=Microdochium trichocladiopsis TaxID=1682393 RepID=A0A9P9BGA0_9PEZI|nr:uncharacterized protein B0I36DRAFT_369429 [Microdochium trichocladiopsis]KAH7014474.1 hypothetical protein B0I36DRAFT_369429 [Microdochium trichocladiopsis]
MTHPTHCNLAVSLLLACDGEDPQIVPLSPLPRPKSSSSYGKASSGTNTYAFGRIGHHNIALTLLPGMGKNRVRIAAAGQLIAFELEASGLWDEVPYLALPKHAVGYYLVPASEDRDVFGTPDNFLAMVEYFYSKNLLEFVLTDIQDGGLLPSLVTFERSSSFHALMEIAGIDWDQMLQEVSLSYFDYACHCWLLAYEKV